MMNKPFDILMEDYNTALAASGVGISARLAKLQRSTVITRRHEAIGKHQLDDKTVADYVCEISDKLHAGEIGQDHANNIRREVEQFVHFVKTGEVKLPNPTLGARVILTPKYQKVVDGFLASKTANFRNDGAAMSPNTRNDMRWTVHKYFEWLTEQGFPVLHSVGAPQIQGFLLHCSETMSMGSIHNIRLYLHKLYAHLYETNQSASSFGMLLSFKVNRGTKIPEIHSSEELADMLDAIDRNTVEGKRAYAVMLLGIVLGLRAVDVMNLKLGDVDWINGEIRLLQAKTAVSVVLPLTKDVGEALEDYILNARPKSGSQYIFLRLHSPHTNLSSPVTIGEIYAACCKAAGLQPTKRFHNLRRSRGTSMLAAGEPVTMVAQILGQHKVDSTKKYISVDTEHLKMCALPFDGIAPVGGARR